jgi:hypothetical protein
MAKKKKSWALAKRYGHFDMGKVHKATADVRKLASDNPLVAAALVGSGIGAIGAGMTLGGAALVGAAAGIAVEQALTK